MWKAGLVVLSLFVLLGCQKTNRQQSTSTSEINLAVTAIPSCALVFIALKNDYFAQEGLPVKSRIQTSGKVCLDSVLEGKADLSTVAETPVMFAALNGDRISIIATISTSNRNNAVIGRRDRGISAPTDLKGKRLAVTLGTAGEFFMDSFCSANGIARKDVHVVNLKPEEMVDALSSGTVDAAVTWNFPLIRLQKELGDKGVVFFDKEIYTETYNIAAQQDFVRKNPDTMKKFLRALVKAEHFAREYPDKSQELVAASLQVDKKLVHEVWSSFEFRVALDQALLVALEDETRWAMKNHLAANKQMPNYLDFISTEYLQQIKNDAVGIVR